MTYVKTKDYVQVSGSGDFTKINIAPGDSGGQFDSIVNTPEGASVKVNGKAASSWVVSCVFLPFPTVVPQTVGVGQKS